MIAALVIVALVGLAWGQAFDVDATWAEARRAEEAGRFADAVEACGRIVAAGPQHARASSCARRLAFLDRRRDAGGGFARWGALQGVRARIHGAPAGEQAELAERVAAIAADPDASPVVRAEAAAWLGQRALDAGDAQAAIVATEGVDGEGLGDDPGVARQVLELRAVALASAGRDAEAVAVERAVRIPAEGAARPTPVEGVIAERRRRWLSAAAGGGLVGFVGAAGAAVALRPGPPLPRPAGLGPIALAAGGAWALVAGWDAGAAVGVPLMAAGFVGVHLLSLAAIPRVSGPLRAGVRALAAAATVAVGWLALAATGTTAWIGL